MSWKHTVLTTKRGTILKAELFEVKHMSRPTLVYLGVPNFDMKPTFLNVCALQLCEDHKNTHVEATHVPKPQF